MGFPPGTTQPLDRFCQRDRRLAVAPLSVSAECIKFLTPQKDLRGEAFFSRQSRRQTVEGGII